MLIIKQLSEFMREELDDACRYIDYAIEHKEEYVDLSNTFYSLAKEEISHADRIHERTVSLIQSIDSVIPDTMKTLWEFEHKIFIEKKEKVEFKIAQYSKY